MAGLDASFGPTPSSAASQQALMVRSTPSEFTILGSVPGYRHISPAEITIIRESHAILRSRPLPRSVLMTIAQDYSPIYNRLAPQFACLRHSMLSLDCYTHFRATGNPATFKLYIDHTGSALAELQHELKHFGPHNCDAVVSASVFMSAAAHNWEQWAVYVDGYTNALAHITYHSLPTAYPDFLSDNLQLCKCSLNADHKAAALPKDIPAMKQHISQSITIIQNLSALIGLPKYCATGFEELEKCAQSLSEALDVTDEAEQYCQLATLRSLLFWIELGKAEESCERRLFIGHFYGLVLAVLPLIPARYAGTLAGICLEKVSAAKEVVGRDGDDQFGLERLLDLADWYLGVHNECVEVRVAKLETR